MLSAIGEPLSHSDSLLWWCDPAASWPPVLPVQRGSSLLVRRWFITVCSSSVYHRFMIGSTLAYCGLSLGHRWWFELYRHRSLVQGRYIDAPR